MLEVVVVLVIIALVLLFLRAGRRNTIVYRKKVSSPDRGYSIRDHPSAFGPPAASDYASDKPYGSDPAFQEALAFGGGEFGGAGAGDSYDIGPNDPGGIEFSNFDAVGSDFNDSDSNSNDFNNNDSGTNDSGSSDSCSDSSGDYTSFSGD